MADDQLDEGAVATVSLTVELEMTAARFARDEGESYPEVYATPVMIGEMERACAALLKPLLKDGQLSVGVNIEIAHMAPTAVGGVVSTHARFVERKEALFWFDVWAEDDKGRIGQGRHSRAIVDTQAVIQRAEKRRSAA